MLTFEKVLSVFEPHLDAMGIEIIKAKHGYLTLMWVDSLNEYDAASTFSTPDALKDSLLGIYECLLVFQKTQGRRDATEQDALDAAASAALLAESFAS